MPKYVKYENLVFLFALLITLTNGLMQKCEGAFLRSNNKNFENLILFLSRRTHRSS